MESTGRGGGTGRSAGGRRGLAGQRVDAPGHTPQRKHRRYGGAGRSGGHSRGAGGRRKVQRAWPRCRKVQRAWLRCRKVQRAWPRCRKVRWAQPRCRWAAAGPGRASRHSNQQHVSDKAPLVWRAPEGPAAVPVGGGGAWPGQPHRHPDRLEAAARPAGPGRTTSRRAERSSRRGRRAGGQAARRPEICRGNEQGRTSGGATSNANARQPKRAAARSRSQWNTQRSRAATTSATWTAFRAAPLRRLSPDTTRTRPRLPSTA